MMSDECSSRKMWFKRFNATDFLERLQGKRLMLVGDSMNRNQFVSILCLLREGLNNKSRMYEIHGHKISKGRGYFVFKFEWAARSGRSYTEDELDEVRIEVAEYISSLI